VPIYINHKLEEKQRLEEQIQQAGALLQSKNVDIETINEFNQLKEKLSKHNLSLEDIIGFANVFPPSLLGSDLGNALTAFAAFTRAVIPSLMQT
jgi:hypothetical protein